MPPEADLDWLLTGLLECAPSARGDYLERATSDPAVRAQLERWARECDDNDPFLTPGGAFSGAFGEDLSRYLAREEGIAEGARLGAYRILHEIGRGGMAIVYLAERADGAFAQRVAVKVVRRGIDTDDTLRRFVQERQIVASIEHPGIARLLDGGLSDEGRAYLVMEHVEGLPLDRYADEARLTVGARLDLFAQICDAVESAHRRLVIHRDIKPGNVLVTGEGVAKLVDFGVAKILAPDVADGPGPMTRADVRVMTPEYASPEQFLREPLTTATDVYSLGVVLYELLAGRRPFEDEETTPHELERARLGRDPAPPSVACGQASARSDPGTRAAARSTTPAALARRLRGDLDTVVLMALRREPDRRYASVAALRADLDRHAAGLPVLARPSTLRYRANRFIRRNRAAVAVAGLLVLAIAAGTAATLIQANAAAREGRRAEAIRDFLVGVFEVSDPARARGEAVTARELLDRGSERVESDLAGDPLLRADMRAVLGRLYLRLGLFDEATGHLTDALALRRQAGAASRQIVESLRDLASVRLEAGAFDEAGALIQEALALARALGSADPAVAATMGDLGAVHRAKGDYAASESIHREAVAIWRAIGDPAGTAAALDGLGVALDLGGKPAEAVATLEEAIALGRLAHGEGERRVVLTECNLAGALHRAGRLDASLAAFKRCVARRRQILGDRHTDVALSLNNQALVHSDLGQYDLAEPLYAEALAIRRAVWGEHHPEVAATLNNLAIVTFQRSRYREAAERFRELIGVWEALVGPDHPNTLTTTNNLGMALRSAGDLEEAAEILERVLAGRRRTLGPDHPEAGASLLNLASVVLRRSEFARARALAEEALPILVRAHPDGHPLVAIGHMTLGRARLGQGAAAEALAAFDRALAFRAETFGPEHLQTAEARVARGRALAALGRVADGRAEIELALAHLTAADRAHGATGREASEALAALAAARD
jgi:serine/threonine-protein kinase